jgi:hypothetical protein
MHEYDVALKRILTRRGSALLRALTGRSRLRWLNVEMPRVSNLRVDLLGALPDGELIHIEFQSRNERGFALRMAEYLFAIRRRYGRLPRQIVLYVGEKPLRMKNAIDSPDLSFRFRLVDIKDLDGEALLAGKNLSDNIIAVLTKLGGEPGTVRRILRRISQSPAAERIEALTELSILAGLRRLSGGIVREAKKMPIKEDIMDNEVVQHLFGRAIAREVAREVAREAAREAAKGRAEGVAQGQREFLLGQIEKKFGPVAPRTRKRLASLTPADLKAAGLRLLDARRIDDLFAR